MNKSRVLGRLARLSTRLQDVPAATRPLAVLGASSFHAGCDARGPAAPSWVCRQGAAPTPFALQHRGLQTSSGLYKDVTITVPSMGDSISEGTIASIEKHEGDAVSDGDVLAQIETDKVTIDVKYTEAQGGVVKKVLVGEEDTVSVDQEVFVVDVGGEAAPKAEKEEKAAPPQEEKKADAPAKEAPKEAKSAPQQEKKPQPPPQPKTPSQPAEKGQAPPSSAASRSERPERRVKMTRLRLRVADRLKGAQNTYAMLSTFNEVDMTGLMELRSQYKDVFMEKHGVKLGFMSAFVKACADGLLAIPAVNGVIDGTDIIYRDYCDISIAVATPKGLVVPVLRDVDKLDFAGVERGINALGKKARDGTISIDDMAGGTFTISNGGVYGSMLSTPIINPPQSAILGMHAITQRATVVGKEILPRPIMNIALTYDHRLIDGREAVTFLKRVKEVIEDPRRMLLGV